MTTSTELPVHTFQISEPERAQLIVLLEQALSETRVEIHRTHTPDYRDRVHGEQSMLHGILDKLQRMPVEE